MSKFQMYQKVYVASCPHTKSSFLGVVYMPLLNAKYLVFGRDGVARFYDESDLSSNIPARASNAEWVHFDIQSSLRELYSDKPKCDMGCASVGSTHVHNCSAYKGDKS